jgi:hypothetical protein
VANVYYEAVDSLTNTKDYSVIANVSTDVPVSMVQQLLAFRSSRVWYENNGNVCFLKNTKPFGSQLTQEEMKEFIWIKLKAI